MDRKKIIAIILFLFLSLFMFSYANPNDLELMETDGYDYNDLDYTVDGKDDEEETIAVVEETTEEDNNVINNVIPNNNFVNPPNNGGNGGNNNPPQNPTNNDNNNNNNTPDIKAPSVRLSPSRVVILEGTRYDVMTGVVVESEENVTARANITDTTKLDSGNHTITYTATHSDGKSNSATRTLVVLGPDMDEDGDGFTNGEEMTGDNKTDPEDKDKHPDTKAPTMKLLGNDPYVMLQNTEYVEAGVKVTLDPHDKVTDVNKYDTDSNLDTNKVGIYEIKYSITDRYGKSAEVTRTVKVLDPNADDDGDGFTNGEELTNDPVTDPEDETKHPDTDAPKIELLGDNPFYLIKGNDYAEPGFILKLDEHDKITKEKDVKVTGDINADKLGEYTLTYTVTDRYGKKSDPVTRKVIVGEDENGNGILDEYDDYYTIKFAYQSVSNDNDEELGKLEGTLEYIDKLELLSFKDAGIIIPTAKPKNEYYELKGWSPNTPTDKTKVGEDNNGDSKVITYIATFGPINDTNSNGIADEEEDYNLTINYVYNDENNTKAADSYTNSYKYGTKYSVDVPKIDYYNATLDDNVIDKVTGTMSDSNTTVTVIYKPIHDENNNGNADELDSHYTVRFLSADTNKGTVVGDKVEHTDMLEGLTFAEAKIVVPTPTPKNFYKFDGWNPEIKDTTKIGDDPYTTEGESEESGVKVITYTANFSPINDENNNGRADEEELTVTFNAGDHGKLLVEGSDELKSTVVYNDKVKDTTFAESDIIIPNVYADKGYVFTGWSEDISSETTITETVTYTAQYDVDPATVQTDFIVRLKPDIYQLKYQVDSEVNIKEKIDVLRVYKDGHEEEVTDYTTNFSTNTIGTFDLVVTSGDDSNSDLEFTITEEKVYDSLFKIELNTSKSYERYVPKLKEECFLMFCNYVWDYNDYKVETIKNVNHNFLEITEFYDQNIEITKIVVEYTGDKGTQELNTEKNEFVVSRKSGDTNGIRWDNYNGSAFIAPVYKTNALNHTEIKYVTLYFKKDYNPEDSLKFKLIDGEFKAIQKS